MSMGPEGHRSLGYCGNGNYRCQCGMLFASPNDTPFRQDEVDSPAPVGWQALKDQWRAHQRDAARRKV